ncbi:hypothetical protein Tsubulata_929654 [Turnera subulata]|uniref:3'-5' exonuclease domain-containing protein n=1 Tax=Turnera subulata TaxID=218843 RepID=A0A9Q0JCE9_9ROSI|nr:hypothetical protein Tsubulata_929654 [Turnera subulata]
MDIFIEPLPSQNPQSETYMVNLFNHRISTTVTATPSVVRRWINQTLHFYRFHRGRLVVGLGVQWVPSSDEAATLQLCVGSRCLIFQLLHTDTVPLCLRRFLEDPDHTFVGVWNHRDEELLESYHNLRVERLIDLRDVADAELGIGRQVSLGRLANEVLGFDGVVKDVWVGRSDWGAEWLSEEQVQYACVDAAVSFLVGKELEAWNWN